MTYANPIIPKDAVVIAEGEGYLIYRWDDKDIGPLYILKGLGGCDYVFNKIEWDRFAKFIAYADLKIRAVVE